jgi:hypothetical protein
LYVVEDEAIDVIERFGFGAYAVAPDCTMDRIDRPSSAEPTTRMDVVVLPDGVDSWRVRIRTVGG